MTRRAHRATRIPPDAMPQPPASSSADAAAMRQDEALLGVSAQDGDGKRIDPARLRWNNIRRAWFVDGPDGPVLVDPQPPPPLGFYARGAAPDVPPAVKITA